MFEYDFTPLAQDNLDHVVQRNPELAEKIIRKIEWLAKMPSGSRISGSLARVTIVCTAVPIESFTRSTPHSGAF